MINTPNMCMNILIKKERDHRSANGGQQVQ